MAKRKPVPCPCGGECCGSVEANPAEVDAILKVTGGGFHDFFTTSPSSGVTHTKVQVLDQPNPRIIVTRCVFFDPSSRLCRIYPHRPKVCRDFSHGED